MTDERLSVSVTLPPRRPRTPSLSAVVIIGPTSAETSRVRPKVPPAEPEDPRLAGISPAAKAIAIAYLVDGWLRDGTVKSMTEAARRLGMTPSRVQQLDRLAGLSPRVVEGVVAGEVGASIRDLEWSARTEAWCEQERWLESLRP